MKNEKGYTLILVLIIISVTMIAVLTLSSAALTTRAQLNKTDTRNKMIDIAEMGITYYQPVVTRYITSAKASARDKLAKSTAKTFDEYFYGDLLALLQTSVLPVEVDTATNKFEITFKTIDKSVANKMIINFESKGMSGSQSATINGFFTIDKISGVSNAGQQNPAKTSYAINESRSLYLSPPSKLTPYNASTYFSSFIQIQGNHTLKIDGNAYFTDLKLAGSAKLNITGDAIFGKDIFIQDNGVRICITGKTYKIDANNNLVDYPIAKNTCSKPSTSDWFFDANKGIKVKY
ncbi:hypothetical protein [Bacillus salipaludis]|uniref:Type 4 fimbrial biogenesis protein PilX N-terminal domain-containing protein n=1 Tax=Bacillus salipaludis TaxID=2547811 RepID=A0ABW8RCU5_9BACI